MKKTGGSRGRGILSPGHLPLQNPFDQARIQPELACDLVEAVARRKPLGELLRRNARPLHHRPAEGAPRIDLDPRRLVQALVPRIDLLDKPGVGDGALRSGAQSEGGRHDWLCPSRGS